MSAVNWLEFAGAVALFVPALGLFWLAVRALNTGLETRAVPQPLRVHTRFPRRR